MPRTPAPSSPMSYAPTSPHTAPATPATTPRTTPPISPRAAQNRLAVPPVPLDTPQCAIPASPHTPAARTAAPPATPRSPRPEITLRQPSQSPQKGGGGGAAARSGRGSKAVRAIRALLRSLPILPPACRPASALPRRSKPHDGHAGGGARVTGTFYGHRRARVTLAVQEKPGSLPWLVLELAVSTGKLMQEVGGGHVRIALECEKKPPDDHDVVGSGSGLLEEALWTAYVNGRRIGYALRREATDDDLAVMQLLSTVSVGAGVLPGNVMEPPPAAAAAAGTAAGDGEVAYMRAGFDRMVGSKDSESFYMVSPDGGGAAGGPELSIFFVRV